MTTFKKTISILLALLMIAGVVAVEPISASATNDDFLYTTADDGTAKIIKYTGSASVLTIPSSLDGKTVTSIGDQAFAFGHHHLTSVTIPNSVTSIGDRAFEGTGLTSITLPDSVTSIDDCAFIRCESLTSVTIPNSVTSIGVNAFKDTAYYNNKDNWENYVLYIGKHLIEAKDSIYGEYNIKSGTLTIGDNAFAYCKSLKSVIIPDSVTSIGHEAFEWCDNLASITIPDSVTNIGGLAFYSCHGLKSVTIPNSVTSIGGSAFYSCILLSDVYYSGTEDDWRRIDIGSSNTPLTSATIHFNYSNQTEPVTAKPIEPATTKPTEPVTTELTKPAVIEQQLTTLKPTTPVVEPTQPNTDKPSATVKKANPIKVSVKAKTVKLKKLKKKAQTVNAIAIKGAQGKVSCKITKAAKIKKYLKINAKGVITFNKWKKAKKGTYSITVQITAKGNANYNSKKIVKTIKIKVKK